MITLILILLGGMTPFFLIHCLIALNEWLDRDDTHRISCWFYLPSYIFTLRYYNDE